MPLNRPDVPISGIRFIIYLFTLYLTINSVGCTVYRGMVFKCLIQRGCDVISLYC